MIYSTIHRSTCNLLESFRQVVHLAQIALQTSDAPFTQKATRRLENVSDTLIECLVDLQNPDMQMDDLDAINEKLKEMKSDVQGSGQEATSALLAQLQKDVEAPIPSTLHYLTATAEFFNQTMDAMDALRAAYRAENGVDPQFRLYFIFQAAQAAGPGATSQTLLAHLKRVITGNDED